MPVFPREREIGPGVGAAALLLASALSLTACNDKAEKAEEVMSPQETLAYCIEASNKMFSGSDEADAKSKKFDRCMSKKLGEDWQTKHPDLKLEAE